MNDTELDRLLNTWNTPAPPASLRESLRARFPRAERRGFARPLRWALGIAAASVVLVVGIVQSSAQSSTQSRESPSDSPLLRALNHIYEHVAGGLETRQAASIRTQIRESEPKVYVDGQMVAPLEYGGGASMDVQVPGEGVYSITAFRFVRLRTADGRPTGWFEAGRIHGETIEFQAGSKQVRIVCNKPIVDSDRPVFALHQP